MNVVILAGGDGRRLRPLTADTPKSLLPLCGKPVLWHLEDWLRRSGVEQAELTAARAADRFRAFAAEPHRRVKFRVWEEAMPLGEAGCLARFGGEELLVLAGDTLPAFSLQTLLQEHRRRGAAATVAVCEAAVGSVAVLADGTVREMRCPAGFSPWQYAGAAVLSATATARLITGERVDMAAFLQRLIRAGETVHAALVDEGGDINTPADYRRAVKWALRETNAPYIGQAVHCGEGAAIDPTTAIEEGAQIGKNVRLCGCVVGAGAVLGEGTEAHDCVIGAGAEIGRNVRLGTDCVIGRGARVADGVTLSPGVRVWPGVSVDSSRLRAAPLRWREVPPVLSAATPQEWTAASLAATGAAIGGEWGGAPVLVCSEGHAADVLRAALIAGLCEAGCAVSDGGDAFLAQAAYLTAALPVKYGAFLGEDGLVLLDECGRELPGTVWQKAARRLEPEDIVRREPYAWQPPRNVAAVRGLYRDRLFQEAADIRPTALTVCGHCAAARQLWEVLRQIGCTHGDAMKLRLSDGGRRLAVHSDETGYLDADRVEELLAWAIGSPSPRPDGLTAALTLLRLLSAPEETLATLNTRLPAAVTVYHTAQITPKTAAALHALGGDALDSEGVRVARPQGIVTVKPAARGRLLSVLARAECAELAEELCGEMMEQLCAIPLDN